MENMRSRNEGKNESASSMVDKEKNKAEEFLKTSSKEIAKKYENVEENIVNYIKEHPWKSLGMSLVSGMILSSLFRK